MTTSSNPQNKPSHRSRILISVIQSTLLLETPARWSSNTRTSISLLLITGSETVRNCCWRWTWTPMDLWWCWAICSGAGGGQLELRMFAGDQVGILSLQYCLLAMGWWSPELGKFAGGEAARGLRGHSSSTKNETDHMSTRCLCLFPRACASPSLEGGMACRPRVGPGLARRHEQCPALPMGGARNFFSIILILKFKF